MRLRIDQTNIQLETRFRMPAVQAEYSRPVFRMEQKPGNLEISLQHPNVKIDATACLADMNMRKPREFMIYYVEKAKSAAAQGVIDKVEEGRRLAAIEKGYTIARLAREKSWDDRQFGLGLVPKQPPEMSAETSEPRIRYEPAELKVRYLPSTIRIKANCDDVKVLVAVRPRIEISAEGEIDRTV